MPTGASPPAVDEYPLADHYRLEMYAPQVGVGARVSVGQWIGNEGPPGDTAAAVRVHAPVTGEVTTLEGTTAGSTLLTVTREDAVADEVAPHAIPADCWLTPLNPETVSLTAFLDRLNEAGIVGLGGGGFPTAAKVALATGNGPAHAVVVNAVACEAGIDSDALILATALPAVATALGALRRVTGAPVVFALGARFKGDADRVRAWLNASVPDAELRQIPEAPAAGAERLLIDTLFRDSDRLRSVRDGQPPTAAGLLCLNLATLNAIGRALTNGEPLVRRAVTLAGSNHWLRIGHPFNALGIEGALRGGGFLSGTCVSREQAVRKTTLAIHPAVARPLPDPCISCGRCRNACPLDLDAEWLYRWIERPKATSSRRQELERNGLDRCFECGYCNLACPSDIDLLAALRAGKADLRGARQAETAQANASQRFIEREARRDANERAAAERRAARLAKRRQPPSSADHG
ncbi:MAG: 4Fe-4S dicluster domain-containing protein [Pseudomonadota bacterium]